ncbi:uncharacterized protein LOC128813834 [Vidua macroura]|uniref:uncharacterized protein LOC128813834 n=1 Tax=Vidua macroura TaxID=187451 RepID=UPI0023A8BBA0|nr:uncharacterized protein LOC128813834 [Vidua macroura]
MDMWPGGPDSRRSWKQKGTLSWFHPHPTVTLEQHQPHEEFFHRQLGPPSCLQLGHTALLTWQCHGSRTGRRIPAPKILSAAVRGSGSAFGPWEPCNTGLDSLGEFFIFTSVKAAHHAIYTLPARASQGRTTQLLPWLLQGGNCRVAAARHRQTESTHLSCKRNPAAHKGASIIFRDEPGSKSQRDKASQKVATGSQSPQRGVRTSLGQNCQPRHVQVH